MGTVTLSVAEGCHGSATLTMTISSTKIKTTSKKVQVLRTAKRPSQVSSSKTIAILQTDIHCTKIFH